MRLRPPTSPDTLLAARRGAFARVVSGAWLVLYALVLAALPVADAGAGHAPVVSHWEDASQSDCPRSHDAATCQLCSVLTAARDLPPASPGVKAAFETMTEAAPGAVGNGPRAPAHAGTSPRGPPLG